MTDNARYTKAANQVHRLDQRPLENFGDGNRLPSQTMICANAFFAAWFAAVIVAEPIERAHQHRLVEKSMAIETGMSPDEVRSILGEPDAIYEYPERSGLGMLLFGSRPTHWMYGTFLNLDYLFVPGLPSPNPLPANLRILHFAPEDLVIVWTSADSVDYVRRPSFDVPEFAESMLDAVNFVDVLVRNVILQPQ